MKIFIDSANLVEIENALKRGFISGVTTNPSLLSKEPKSGFEKHVKKIIALLKKDGRNLSLSVEVFSRDAKEIIKQALHFKKIFKYKSLSIKVQIGWNELEAISRLSREGISVNCTACMTVPQALLAANAGAKYVSLFWCRIRDGATDNPHDVVAMTRKLLDEGKSTAEIITGSIRSVEDIRDAFNAGAHIVTIPSKFFIPMVEHFKTTEAVDQFFKDFSAWQK
ncbi:MAG: fructose-6-phosphate aldolase [Candidatus Taylorbacteria bacterium]|nr:fructose-6-phosphate aldolase [Candidatus Taylorbacteria bacterium]